VSSEFLNKPLKMKKLAVAESTNPKPVKVLVIEYGDIDDSPDRSLPYASRYINQSDLINYASIPQPGLKGRRQNLQTAAVVGGGSVVNGMSVDRGSAADYDTWESLGNFGWGWDTMSQLLKGVR